MSAPPMFASCGEAEASVREEQEQACERQGEAPAVNSQRDEPLQSAETPIAEGDAAVSSEGTMSDASTGDEEQLCEICNAG